MEKQILNVFPLGSEPQADLLIIYLSFSNLKVPNYKGGNWFTQDIFIWLKLVFQFDAMWIKCKAVALKDMKKRTINWLLDYVGHMAHCSVTENTCSGHRVPSFQSRIYLWLSMKLLGNIFNLSQCLSYSSKKSEYLPARFVHVRLIDTCKSPGTGPGV